MMFARWGATTAARWRMPGTCAVSGGRPVAPGTFSIAGGLGEVGWGHRRPLAGGRIPFRSCGGADSIGPV